MTECSVTCDAAVYGSVELTLYLAMLPHTNTFPLRLASLALFEVVDVASQALEQRSLAQCTCTVVLMQLLYAHGGAYWSIPKKLRCEAMWDMVCRGVL